MNDNLHKPKLKNFLENWPMTKDLQSWRMETHRVFDDKLTLWSSTSAHILEYPTPWDLDQSNTQLSMQIHVAYASLDLQWINLCMNQRTVMILIDINQSLSGQVLQSSLHKTSQAGQPTHTHRGTSKWVLHIKGTKWAVFGGKRIHSMLYWKESIVSAGIRTPDLWVAIYHWATWLADEWA